MRWIGDRARYAPPPPTLRASAAAFLATSLASIFASVAAAIACGSRRSASHAVCSATSRAARSSTHTIAVSDFTHEASASRSAAGPFLAFADATNASMADSAMPIESEAKPTVMRFA